MKTKLFLLTAALGATLLALPSCAAPGKAAPTKTDGALTLAQNGKSSYVIVLSADAIPAEKTAAQQLQNNLQKVTGATLPIKNESEVAASAPQILVGASTRAKRLLPQQNWTALRTDGIVIKTTGKNLILAGGRPRGALYAVFDFLEKQVGVRWWTPTESTIPRKPTLRVLAQNVVYTPQIPIRELFYTSVQRDPLFATQLKINGHFQTQGPELGGHNSILGWAHTFAPLLPPEEYFKAHPEWYSDPANGDKPCTAASAMPGAHTWQLNLTNDAMRAELTKVALQWIRKNPEAGMISISQNDNQNYCRSAGDMAIIEREGAPSGALLDFVNKVAADIEKQYPSFLVETLAYQYTRKPPRTIKPRHNVVIRLASIEGDSSQPLDSEANAGFRADVRGWSAISSHLYIWNYVTNFSNVILPHPNLRVLAPNVRFFAANKAIGVFEQGDAYSNSVGDFVQLRVWLLSHLLWNPQQDEKKLTDEFLKGYYGAAAPHLKQYLNLMGDAVKRSGVKLGINNGDYSFLTLDVMNRATTLFDAATKAVTADGALSKRVRRARLTLDDAWTLRYTDLQRQAQVDKQEFRGPSDIQAYADDFIRTAQSFGVEHYREGGLFAGYVPQVRARLGLPAPPVPSLAELQNKVPPGTKTQNVIDVQQSEFRLAREGEWTSLVDDPAASDKKAARMRGDMTQWATQVPYPTSIKRGDVWRYYVVARIELKAGAPKTGGALGCGIYEGKGNASVTVLSRTVQEIGDGGYHVIDLGAYQLTPDAYFWVAPMNNPSVEAVYVDRIILLREEKAPQP